MTALSLSSLLLRVQRLHADYLSQADALTPTVSDVAAWLCQMHAMPVGTVDEGDLDPALPRQLLALPLFRHYLVSEACGPARRFIIDHLEPVPAAAFNRLSLPALEFKHVLNQWNACLHRLQQATYRIRLVEEGQTAAHAYRHQVSGMVSHSLPEFSMQYLTLCALPPGHPENRKVLHIGGPGQGMDREIVEAYPQRAATCMVAG